MTRRFKKRTSGGSIRTFAGTLRHFNEILHPRDATGRFIDKPDFYVPRSNRSTTRRTPRESHLRSLDRHPEWLKLERSDFTRPGAGWQEGLVFLPSDTRPLDFPHIAVDPSLKMYEAYFDDPPLRVSEAWFDLSPEEREHTAWAAFMRAAWPRLYDDEKLPDGAVLNGISAAESDREFVAEAYAMLADGDAAWLDQNFPGLSEVVRREALAAGLPIDNGRVAPPSPDDERFTFGHEPYAPIEPDLFDFEGDDHYDRYRRAKQKFDDEVAELVALGELPPEDAPTKLPGAAAEKWEPLPPKLWHVATAAGLIEAEGFRSRKELALSNGLGLGGGPDDVISFTDDYDTAANIYSTMMEAHAVARGDLTLADLLQLDADDAWGLGSGTLLPRWLQVTGGLVSGARDANAEMEGWKPGDPMPSFFTDADLDDRMQLYRAFISTRQYAGGPEDPLFFSTDWEGFSKIDPAEIAILEIDTIPGTWGGKLGVAHLNEWRVPPGALPDTVVKAERPAVMPPTTPEPVLALRTSPVADLPPLSLDRPEATSFDAGAFRSTLETLDLDETVRAEMADTYQALTEAFGETTFRGVETWETPGVVAAVDTYGTLHLDPSMLTPDAIDLLGQTGFTVASDAQGIVAHEFAHRLFAGSVDGLDDPFATRLSAASLALDAANRAAAKQLPDGVTPLAAARTLSPYAGTNDQEAYAELFTAYWSPSVDSPGWVQAWGDSFTDAYGDAWRQHETGDRHLAAVEPSAEITDLNAGYGMHPLLTAAEQESIGGIDLDKRMSLERYEMLRQAYDDDGDYNAGEMADELRDDIALDIEARMVEFLASRGRSDFYLEIEDGQITASNDLGEVLNYDLGTGESVAHALNADLDAIAALAHATLPYGNVFLPMRIWVDPFAADDEDDEVSPVEQFEAAFAALRSDPQIGQVLDKGYGMGVSDTIKEALSSNRPVTYSFRPIPVLTPTEGGAPKVNWSARDRELDDMRLDKIEKMYGDRFVAEVRAHQSEMEANGWVPLAHAAGMADEAEEMGEDASEVLSEAFDEMLNTHFAMAGMSVFDISWDSDSVTVSGRLEDASDSEVTRTLNFRDGSVYHALLTIPVSQQGGGIGYRFNRANDSWYIANGMTTVSVSAGLSEGGYAWASDLFKMPDHAKVDALARIGSRTEMILENPTSYSRQEVISALQARRDLEDIEQLHPHQMNGWNISHIGWHPEVSSHRAWVGRSAMQGSSWNGTKNLRELADLSDIDIPDPDDYQRGRDADMGEAWREFRGSERHEGTYGSWLLDETPYMRIETSDDGPDEILSPAGLRLGRVLEGQNGNAAPIIDFDSGDRQTGANNIGEVMTRSLVDVLHADGAAAVFRLPSDADPDEVREYVEAHLDGMGTTPPNVGDIDLDDWFKVHEVNDGETYVAIGGGSRLGLLDAVTRNEFVTHGSAEALFAESSLGALRTVVPAPMTLREGDDLYGAEAVFQFADGTPGLTLTKRGAGGRFSWREAEFHGEDWTEVQRASTLATLATSTGDDFVGSVDSATRARRRPRRPGAVGGAAGAYLRLNGLGNDMVTTARTDAFARFHPEFPGQDMALGYLQGERVQGRDGWEIRVKANAGIAVGIGPVGEDLKRMIDYNNASGDGAPKWHAVQLDTGSLVGDPAKMDYLETALTQSLAARGLSGEIIREGGSLRVMVGSTTEIPGWITGTAREMEGAFLRYGAGTDRFGRFRESRSFGVTYTVPPNADMSDEILALGGWLSESREHGGPEAIPITFMNQDENSGTIQEAGAAARANGFTLERDPDFISASHSHFRLGVNP